MASLPMFAAVVAAGVAAVQGAPAVEATATGQGLQALQEVGVSSAGCLRVHWYNKEYDAGIDPDNFFSENNAAWGLPASSSGPVFLPSQATSAAGSHILYGPKSRRPGTHIFEGVIELPKADMAGDYVFKLTTDVSAHMLINDKVVIDNGGFHSRQTRTANVKLEAGKQYPMQVWWGNWKSDAEAQLKFCRMNSATVEAAEVVRQLEDASGGIDAEDLSNELLELAGCQDRTNLWEIMKYLGNSVKPFIMRYELKGFFNGDIEKYNIGSWAANKETANLPLGHSAEYGGVISISPKDQSQEPWADTTTIYTVKIAARAYGMHTFWVHATATALLYIDDTQVVAVSNAAAPTWRKGSIWLEKGEAHELTVYYGTPAAGSMLSVLWQDDLAAEPMESLMPIMTPHE